MTELSESSLILIQFGFAVTTAIGVTAYFSQWKSLVSTYRLRRSSDVSILAFSGWVLCSLLKLVFSISILGQWLHVLASSIDLICNTAIVLMLVLIKLQQKDR